MSVASWKKEFYPVPANRVHGGRKALEHSLLKWSGLLRKNLRKHKVKRILNRDIFVYDGNDELVLDIVASDACCQIAERTRGCESVSKCIYCPIFRVTRIHCVYCADLRQPSTVVRLLRKCIRKYKK